MNKSIIIQSMIALGVTLSSCSDSWLKPDPLSFYTPENAYTDADGMYGSLTSCDRNARHEFFNDQPPIVTEYIFSDLAVEGTTDKAGPAQNMNIQITPTSELNNGDYNKVGWYWSEGYKGLKYANVVIGRIDDATYKSEAERNEVLGAAYFQRSCRYYRLVHQFGDVPSVNLEVKEPRIDYYTVDRWAILNQIKKDMEFAYQHVKDDVDRGRPSKAACGHLLTKINLALGNFDEAIKISSEIINGGRYRLMTERFGTPATWIDPMTPDATIKGNDVISDLHWHQNRAIAANKEVLYMVISREELIEGSDRMQSMRQAVPFFWNTGNILKTPNGKQGISDKSKINTANIEVDLVNAIGRGIGRLRGTHYATVDIWDDPNDMRHTYPNWRTPLDMVWNNPDLKKSDPDSYLKRVTKLVDAKGNNITTGDTIRSWSEGWPHYKVFNPDPTQVQPAGGRVDWYIFRLAETYLLRAEAYVWKGQPELAMADINKIRTRAGAAPLTDASKVTILTVLAERAKELFYEEPRKTELTRIAYIFAKTGKASPYGTYSLENFSDKNFWYDHIMATTDFYNKGVKTVYGNEYRISPYHVLWPIPQGAIDDNALGRINQNKGYSGYEKNKPALKEVPDNQ